MLFDAAVISIPNMTPPYDLPPTYQRVHRRWLCFPFFSVFHFKKTPRQFQTADRRSPIHRLAPLTDRRLLAPAPIPHRLPLCAPAARCKCTYITWLGRSERPRVHIPCPTLVTTLHRALISSPLTCLSTFVDGYTETDVPVVMQPHTSF